MRNRAANRIDHAGKDDGTHGRDDQPGDGSSHSGVTLDHPSRGILLGRDATSIRRSRPSLASLADRSVLRRVHNPRSLECTTPQERSLRRGHGRRVLNCDNV